MALNLNIEVPIPTHFTYCALPEKSPASISEGAFGFHRFGLAPLVYNRNVSGWLRFRGKEHTCP